METRAAFQRGKTTEGEDSDGPWPDNSRGKRCCDSHIMGKVMLLGFTFFNLSHGGFLTRVYFCCSPVFLFVGLFFSLCASGDGVGYRCLGDVVRVTSILTSLVCPPPSHC